MVTVLENLRTFRSSQKLRDLIRSFIASQIFSVHQAFYARHTFIAMDKDCDGRIGKNDLIQNLQRVVSKAQAEEQAQLIFQEIDTDLNGFIEFTEYSRAFIRSDAVLNRHNLLIAFRLIDENDDGLLRMEELKNKLGSFTKNEDTEMWRDLVKDADTNGDGAIDLEEFTEFLLNNCS